jgi:hypothetical protein
MSKTVLAQLVTKMTVESTQFKRELERTTAKTVKFSQSQNKAANDSGKLAASQKRTSSSTRSMSDAFRQAANSAATLSGPMGGISSRLGTLATGMATVGVAGVALGAAIGAISFAVIASVGVFSKLEQGLLRTEALVKATGGASGKTAEQLEELTRSVALSTLASVEGVRQAVNVLQTFKSIQGTSFERTIKLSQDLAAVMGSDIKSSALQLGKALEDPILGLNSLRRSGVSFSESQKEVIKNLVATGQTAQAQVMILDTLEKQVGGAGGAEAGGLAGAADTLSQRWQELLERFAQTSGVGDTVTYTLNRIARGMNIANEAALGAQTSAEKLTALFNEYRIIQTKIDSGGKVSSVSKQRVEQIKEEIKAINKQTSEESEIFKNGAIDRKQQAEDAAKSLADKNNTLGLKTLVLLERQMADENQLVIIKHQEKLTAIEGLNLSEKEVRKRGFESISELKDYNIGLINEQAEAEFEVIKEKNQKEIDAEKSKQDKITAIAKKSADQRLLEGLRTEKLARDAFTSLQNELAAENNPAELARQQMQARLDVIREYYQLESLEAAKATQAGVAAVLSYKKAIKDDDLFGTLTNSLSGLQDQVSGTLGQMALGMTDGDDAAKALARTIVTQLTGSMINYGIEQVIAYATGATAATAAEGVKALAVTGGIATQTLAATAATGVLTTAGVASGGAIAAAMAPAAAATSVATAGAAPAAATPIALGTIGAIIAAIVGVTAIAGAREKGGPVSGGRTYLVGEKGPELFTPGATGQITSNDKMNKFSGNSELMQPTMIVNINGKADDDVFAQIDRQRKKFGRMVQQVMKTPF